MTKDVLSRLDDLLTDLFTEYSVSNIFVIDDLEFVDSYNRCLKKKKIWSLKSLDV